MSSFIVDNKTINRVVDFMAYSLKETTTIKDKLTKMGFDLSTYEGRVKLASALYALNLSGVSQRYGTADDMIGEPFTYIPTGGVNSVQSFKSLQCLMYQCMEGEVPEKSDLYKLLDTEVRPYLAEYIVNRLPEYDNLEWG